LGGLVLFSPLAFVGAWRVRLRKGRKGEYLKIVALYAGLVGIGGAMSAWTYEDVEGIWVYISDLAAAAVQSNNNPSAQR